MTAVKGTCLGITAGFTEHRSEAYLEVAGNLCYLISGENKSVLYDLPVQNVLLGH